MTRIRPSLQTHRIMTAIDLILSPLPEELAALVASDLGITGAESLAAERCLAIATLQASAGASAESN